LDPRSGKIFILVMSVYHVWGNVPGEIGANCTVWARSRWKKYWLVREILQETMTKATEVWKLLLNPALAPKQAMKVTHDYTH